MRREMLCAYVPCSCAACLEPAAASLLHQRRGRRMPRKTWRRNGRLLARKRFACMLPCQFRQQAVANLHRLSSWSAVSSPIELVAPGQCSGHASQVCCSGSARWRRPSSRRHASCLQTRPLRTRSRAPASRRRGWGRTTCPPPPPCEEGSQRQPPPPIQAAQSAPSVDLPACALAAGAAAAHGRGGPVGLSDSAVRALRRPGSPPPGDRRRRRRGQQRAAASVRGAPGRGLSVGGGRFAFGGTAALLVGRQTKTAACMGGRLGGVRGGESCSCEGGVRVPRTVPQTGNVTRASSRHRSDCKIGA